VAGDALAIQLRAISQAGILTYVTIRKKPSAFYQAGRAQGGSGVIVLPQPEKRWWIGSHDCCAVNTLVLTSSLTSVRQWRRELLDKTTLPEDAIAEYSGESKQTAPVTLATYQILSYRSSKDGEFPHFQLFSARSWA